MPPRACCHRVEPSLANRQQTVCGDDSTHEVHLNLPGIGGILDACAEHAEAFRGRNEGSVVVPAGGA